ncbi:MAG: hypothetical protein ABUK01_02430 [Leptospirales bacterium]
MEKPIVIHYRFKFTDDNRVTDYLLRLDPKTITFIPPTDLELPDWVNLEFNKCDHCPLDPKEHQHCPVARNLAGFVEHFKNEISHTEALIIVRANDRYYSKQLSLQEGLYSVYGIIMSTSNCPMMNFLKPMARYHLPFASLEETIFRTTSSYLLEQYYAHKRGEEADLKLDGLLFRYQEVEKVNEGISRRLRAVTSGDADRNAVVLLDSLAQVLFFELGTSLESMEYLYGQSVQST